MYSVTVEGHFCAAHFLPGVPKCESLHGHNYKVEVEIRSRGPLVNGMLVNFRGAKELLRTLLDELDHKCLNDFFFVTGPYWPPTAENLARWIFDGLKAGFRGPPPRQPPYKVTVWETPRCSASYWVEYEA